MHVRAPARRPCHNRRLRMTETGSQKLQSNGVWDDVSRVESWAGEVRVNLVRIIAIVLFYGRHLVAIFTAGDTSPERGRYHLLVTAITLAWAALAVILH